MRRHSPRAFPWGVAAPVGTPYVKVRRSGLPRGRRPRPRSCLRKGCGREYQPRSWNQRDCQDPECVREVHRWQAARRQAKHRQDALAKAQHAETERVRRQRAKSAPQATENPQVTPARGSRRTTFFSLPLCDRPGCYESPVMSVRNPARYCCPVCRQAVRNVQDRERKCLSRGTLDGCSKRAHEYRVARERRSP
jgi:hypothetical protein